MSLSRRTLPLAALIAVASPVAAQQSQPPTAPRILQIYQELVKPGKASAHERHEQGWPTAFGNAKTENYYVALVGNTGAGDAWYVNSYGSYADWAAADAKIAKVAGLQSQLDALSDKDAEFLSGARSIVAVLQDSLAIGTAPEFAKVHGWRVTTVRVKLGHTDSFEAGRKLLRDAYAKAGIDPHIGVYVVSQGVNTPTYLIFRPYSSIADFDAWPATGRAMGQQLTQEQRDMLRKIDENDVLTREADNYAVSPKQSYIPAAWAAADPDFWKTNPVVAMRARARANVAQAGKPMPAKKP